jgi:hypothetical protein
MMEYQLPAGRSKVMKDREIFRLLLHILSSEATKATFVSNAKIILSVRVCLEPFKPNMRDAGALVSFNTKERACSVARQR